MRRSGSDDGSDDGEGDFYAPRKLRKSDAGIKTRRRRGDFVEHWWAARWIESLERITNPGRLRRGRSYARGGQVLSVEESKGRIQARVQGSQANPYRVTIRLEPLSDRAWQAVIEALAERAIFSAQLLAGEMPHEIEEAFTAAGVTLLPASSDELESACSCPDWANPCKHVAAVHYILGEQFDEDPFLIFRLRGRSQEQIMAALAARRETQAAPAAMIAEEPAPYVTVEAAPPLEETLAAFWQMGQALHQFPTDFRTPAQPYPILRRLGPAGFAENLESELGPVYDAMTRAALREAFAADAADANTDTDPEEETQ
ncbi:MAG: SWIM zinc finger family protein [Caldilineaceae bacterium]|nr:SWIM zinc finger family protein [Caldilineaceae bacterium]